MNLKTTQLYQFGPFILDPGKRFLKRLDEVVPLTPKAFDMLLVLVENSGKVLEKGDLMNRLWPNTFVEESNLAFQVSTLRKALGESPERPWIHSDDTGSGLPLFWTGNGGV